MVQILGFDAMEEHSIRQLMAQFHAGEHHLGELMAIEKAHLPGYDGKVVPRRTGSGDGLEMTMYLSSCRPFTIAHELAHVSDIAVRRRESLANLTCEMPSHWHLAYKMSSEYYANRIACGYADGDDCFRAFRSDAAGLLSTAGEKDWGSFLVYYALLLGVLHGIGRMELDPLKMVRPKAHIPVRVLKGMAHFRRQAEDFFDGYHLPRIAAAAA